MNKRKPGFLESFGRSIDESFQDAKDDIQEGVERMRKGFKELFDSQDPDESNEPTQSSVDSMAQIKKILMARLEDIAMPTGDGFSYSSILKWVKENHIGNKFYMIKYLNNKSKNTYLFVFFGKDDELMLEKKHPMVCYRMKSLPEGIADLFNGKQIFIQKFE